MQIGLIVGTGMESLTASTEWSEYSTPYGPAYLGSLVLGGQEVILLRRHGPMVNIPPHLINYRANTWALKSVGVEQVIATAAVGSLRKDLPPGSIAVMDDFIDFTRHRPHTIFDVPGEAVVHIDFTHPYSTEISQALVSAATQTNIKLADPVVYLCVDGPRYETAAEIRMFARWGADVVGMTGVPELVLAKETGISYGALAVVTNFAAGISDHPLSHQEVLAVMHQRSSDIERVIEDAIALLPENA